MALLNRDGVNIYYETHGQGPAILLSHGYSATSKMWAGQIALFSRAHKLIVWDMRGHGRSDSPADPALYSEAHTVDDMAALLDAAGAEDAIIAGLSLGGYMALAFQLAHPQRTRALMLFDTGPGYRNDEARAGWNKTALARADRFEQDGLSVLRPRGEVDPANHSSALGLANAARGMLAQKDARIIDSLPRITAPTLVLVGAKDEPYLGASDYMAAKIPGARKTVIPDAGHAANIDQPAAFNAAAEAFLDDLEKASANARS
jgi:pimeloyl-ACP methyl ester carboxylesterase